MCGGSACGMGGGDAEQQRKAGTTADKWSSSNDELFPSCPHILIPATPHSLELCILGIQNSFVSTFFFLTVFLLDPEAWVCFSRNCGQSVVAWFQVQSCLPYILAVRLWANHFPPVNLSYLVEMIIMAFCFCDLGTLSSPLPLKQSLIFLVWVISWL